MKNEDKLLFAYSFLSFSICNQIRDGLEIKKIVSPIFLSYIKLNTKIMIVYTVNNIYLIDNPYNLI